MSDFFVRLETLLQSSQRAESVPMRIDPDAGAKGGEACLLLIKSVLFTRRSSSISRLEMSVPVLIPRTRTISVRLSEKEHAALEKFCLDGGARCISDLARNAIHSFVSRAAEENVLLESLVQNSAQVKELEQKLEGLAVEFASLKAGMRPPWISDAAAIGEKRFGSRRKREPAKDQGGKNNRDPSLNR